MFDVEIVRQSLYCCEVLTPTALLNTHVYLATHRVRFRVRIRVGVVIRVRVRVKVWNGASVIRFRVRVRVRDRDRVRVRVRFTIRVKGKGFVPCRRMCQQCSKRQQTRQTGSN